MKFGFLRCRLDSILGAAKKQPFKVLIWNFTSFIYENVLRLSAKQNIILLKNDKIISFWTWSFTDFLALKMFKLKCYLIFKNRLPRYCRCRHSDALTNSNLFCL